jgi:hypothetical protein
MTFRKTAISGMTLDVMTQNYWLPLCSNVMLSVIILSLVMLGVSMLCVIKVSVIAISGFMQNVTMLNVIILFVNALWQYIDCHFTEHYHATCHFAS